MFHRILVLFLVSSLAPAFAFAESSAPCNLVDQEALVALELSAHTAKMEHKEISGTAGVTRQFVDTCIFTPPNAPSPSLAVTATPMHLGKQATTHSCADKSLPNMGLFICNAALKNSHLTFVLVTRPSSEAAMKSVFPAQVKRLIESLVGPAAKVSAAKVSATK